MILFWRFYYDRGFARFGATARARKGRGSKAMSAGFKELEAKYKQERRTIDRIEHPRVLCIASKQCCEPKFKFDLDVQVLQKYFPTAL